VTTPADTDHRRLEWEACLNVRDLGGLPIAGGGDTRWGAVVRADLLTHLTPAGREAMVRYGVRTVIDLRGPHEVSEEPVLPTLPEGIAYHNLPLEEYDPEVSARISAATSRGEVYALILDHYPAAAARALRAVIAAGPGGVVIHCAAGKDRTGIVSAFLLGLAGVREEAIVADYAVSDVNLMPQYIADREAGLVDDASIWRRPTATPEQMRALLDHLHERYGGMEGYLRRAGLEADEIERLKRVLRPA